MPIYNRKCQKCQYTLEDSYENITADNVIECPSCHSLCFVKLPTSASIKFNGEGWTEHENKGNMGAYEKELEKSTTIHL